VTIERRFSGGIFVGYAMWPQEANRQDDEEQDILMEEACRTTFAGTRPASISEITEDLIVDLPATNTYMFFVLGTCPHCAGRACDICIDGHARRCVTPGTPWPDSHALWTNEDNCTISWRGAICIR